jgi:hypothetical protein
MQEYRPADRQNHHAGQKQQRGTLENAYHRSGPPIRAI